MVVWKRADTPPPLPLGAPPRRSFRRRAWTLSDLVAAKGPTTVSVALPARNEGATVGRIVEVLARDAVGAGLVDELVDDLLLAVAARGDGFAVAAHQGAHLARCDEP